MLIFLIINLKSHCLLNKNRIILKKIRILSLPQHIKNFVNLTYQEEQEIGHLFHREELPKGHLIFQQGEICRRAFFIEKGLARYYHYSHEGKEITGWFFAENQLIAAMDSFYKHKPTNNYCELLEDSIIYSIKLSDLDEMLNKSHTMAIFFFHAMYWGVKKLTEFLYSIRFQTAQERYKILLHDYPFLFQRVKLSYIASYLDITPETLSRLRAEK
jgi:CRP/FNR family transcriptional regulator, anaerobic regulatory protein